MARLEGSKITIQKTEEQTHDVDQLLSEIDCLNIDIARFTKARDEKQAIVDQAREQGYLSPQEKREKSKSDEGEAEDSKGSKKKK